MKNMKKILAGFLSAVILTTSILPTFALKYSGSSLYNQGKYHTALTKVTLTGDQRADIVAVAKSQVGYHEGGNKGALSGTSSGSSNYTEYGRWFGSYGAWCSVFVSWCAAQAGINTSSKTVVPKTDVCHTGYHWFYDDDSRSTSPNTYSVTYDSKTGKSTIERGYTPQPGDIIYFKLNTDPKWKDTDHVGIVTSYDKSSRTIYTIEGNSGDSVSEKYYDLDTGKTVEKVREIVAICSPNYTVSAYKDGKYYTNLQNVTLTGNQRTDIVNIAKSQVGYYAGSNKNQLSGMVKTGGYYTEYGRWFGVQDGWSAMFVAWCGAKAGVSSYVVPQKLYCVDSLTKFTENDTATDYNTYYLSTLKARKYTPRPGDLVYFKTSSSNSRKTDHMGIVTSYDKSTNVIYTVEGSYGSRVVSTSHDLDTTTKVVAITAPWYSTK